MVFLKCLELFRHLLQNSRIELLPLNGWILISGLWEEFPGEKSEAMSKWQL
jgi:hypothetical protein